MTNPTYVDIKADIGTAWSGIDGTTTTIVNSLLTKAKNKLNLITGTTTGNVQDFTIRTLSAAYAVNNVLSGLGPESVNRDNFQQMYTNFMAETKSALMTAGYSPDGISIQFESVNQ